MNVLITGGCGFLGRHFTAALAADHDVTIVDDLSSGIAYGDWPDELTQHRPSRIIYRDFRQVLDSDFWDLVIHLAATVGGRSIIEGDPAANMSSFGDDGDFFRWAARAKPGRIIYPSSSAVYPVSLQGTNGVPLEVTDYDPSGATFRAPDAIYGWTKLIGEVMANEVAAKYGVPVLCLRPFSGYGFDQSPDYPMPAICRRAAVHEDPLTVWGSGDQGRDFVHVDDLVRLALDGVEYVEVGECRAMNIGTGVLTTFVELAQLAADAAGYDPVVRALSDRPEGVAHRVAAASVSMVGGIPIGSPRISLKDGVADIVRRLA